MNSPKVYNALITKSKDTEVVEIPGKEIKSLILKISITSNRIKIDK
jgi:hypothetical protein